MILPLDLALFIDLDSWNSGELASLMIVRNNIASSDKAKGNVNKSKSKIQIFFFRKCQNYRVSQRKV